MLSKNNKLLRAMQEAPQRQHFSIRKLTIGAVSVLLSTTFGFTALQQGTVKAADNEKAAQVQPTQAPTINKAELSKLVAEKDAFMKSDAYAKNTDVKKNAYTAAVSKGQAVLVDAKASQADVNSAVNEINAAKKHWLNLYKLQHQHQK